MKRRVLTIFVLFLIAAISLSACAPAEVEEAMPAEEEAMPAEEEEAPAEEVAEVEEGGCKYGEDGTCKVALLNSFLGNDWRVQMQNSALIASEMEPYASDWEFEVVSTDNTDEAMNAAIENLLAEGVDAILVDCASDTGQNDVIERACDEGVVVVTYDVTAQLDSCNINIVPDFYEGGKWSGMWIGEKLGCEGNVIMDKGLQGVSIADDIYQGNLDGLEEACGDGITVVGDYYGEFSATVQEPLISALLASNPDVQAVLGEADVSTIKSAFEDAGLPSPVMRGAGSNANLLVCAEEGVDCFLTSNTPAVSIGAMEIAYDALNGEDIPKQMPYPLEHFGTDTSIELGVPYSLIEEGVNAFPDLAPGFQPAFNWPGARVELTLDQLLNFSP